MNKDWLIKAHNIEILLEMSEDTSQDEDDNNDVDKSRISLKPGEKAPEGKDVKIGPRGGRYYESSPSGNKPKNKVVIASENTPIQFRGQDMTVSNLPSYNPEGGSLSTKQLDAVQKSLKPYKMAGEVVLLKGAMEGAAGVTFMHNPKKQIFVSNLTDDNREAMEAYKEFAKNQDLPSKDLTEIDWLRSTALHENGHQLVFQNLNVDETGSIALKDLPAAYGKALEKLHGDNLSQQTIDEQLAEDLRILNARKHNDKVQHILNVMSWKHDLRNPDAAEARQNILIPLLQ